MCGNVRECLNWAWLDEKIQREKRQIEMYFVRATTNTTENGEEVVRTEYTHTHKISASTQ